MAAAADNDDTLIGRYCGACASGTYYRTRAGGYACTRCNADPEAGGVSSTDGS